MKRDNVVILHVRLVGSETARSLNDSLWNYLFSHVSQFYFVPLSSAYFS